MDEEKKEVPIDYDIKVSHNNMLWLIYRALSENMISAEELEKIVNKIM
ncbi:MAG: hypothetical protein IJP13_07825 [Lachnospiraceae bacterium]|nr:hypothetical protein [Lachnospiraceae bacterium]